MIADPGKAYASHDRQPPGPAQEQAGASRLTGPVLRCDLLRGVTKMAISTCCMAAGVVLLSLGAAQAAPMVATGDNGMPLYTFDQDLDGKSVCYQKCAQDWPPFLGKADARMGEGYTLHQRADGTMQWSYKNKPLYYYHEDTPGHAKGDGVGGVWHVLTH